MAARHKFNKGLLFNSLYVNRHQKWTPANLSTGVLWYNNQDSSTITKDGVNKISQIVNKKNVGTYDAVQTVSVNQPIWQDLINGYKGADNAANDCFLDSQYMPDGGAKTIAIVINTGADLTNATLFGCNDGASHRLYCWMETSTTIRIGFGGGSLLHTLTNAWGTNEEHIIIIRFRGSGDTFDVYVDGDTISETSGSMTFSGTSGTNMMLSAISSTANFVDGGFGEFILTNAAESDATITQIYEYLAAQWGFSYSIPSGFLYNPPFNIYRLANNIFSTDFDMDAKANEPVDNDYYVNINTGDDTKDGSSATPFKSIHVACAKTGSKRIHVAAGTYGYQNGFKGAAPVGDKLIVQAVGGRVRATVHEESPTWTLDAGSVYKATITTDTIQDVVDFTDTDADGIPVAMTFGSSATLNAGEYWVNGSVVYVRTLDSRDISADDSDIYVYLQQYNAWLRSNLNYIYLEGIDFEGGVNAVAIEQELITDEYYANDCTMRYSSHFTASSTRSGGTVIIKDCQADYGYGDSLGYTKALVAADSCNVVEINCTARYAGQWGNTATNVNGSTAHDAVNIIRINGDYQASTSRIIDDIGTGTSLLLGCTSQNSRGADSSTSINLSVGDTRRTWADSCDIAQDNGTSLTGFRTTTSAELLVYNTPTTGNNTNNGTLTSYTG